MKPSLQQLQAAPFANRVHVKFREGSGVRAGGGSLTAGTPGDVSEVQGALAAIGASTSALRPMFSRPDNEIAAERDQAQLRSGEQLPDLNLWFIIDLPAGANAAAVANQLNALDIVEFAEPERLPSPPPVDIAPPTPNFTSQQGYRAAINLPTTAQLPGSDGANMRFVDVEYSWLLDHEDLEIPTTRIVVPSGRTASDPFNNRDHGTAVLGQIVGMNNAYGVTGIAPAATAFVAPSNFTNGYVPAAAINAASSVLQAGDVIVIEQQAGACGGECGSSQDGCGPQEAIQSVFDAVKNATAAGRIVVAAAGNGNVNLDAPQCNGNFDRNVRDSGAIIVGAGNSTDRSRLSFSSYGSRVDVQGWGNNVVTTGYGTLFKTATTNDDERQRYASSFGGTSGATPIVSGAVLSINGARRACGAQPATPSAMRTALVSTGTPQGNPAGGLIGPLPRIPEALAALGGCGGTVKAAHDFDGNTKSDILWRQNTGDVAAWFMNGASIASSVGYAQIANDWTIVGQRDFDGNGKADILWRQNTGDLAIWFMNGGAISSSVVVTKIDPAWAIVGTGDMSNDSRGDILWRHTSTGDLAVWLMDGATITATAGLGSVSTAWQIVGHADLNGDGRADIIWRSPSTGQMAVWFMSGTTVASSAALPSVSTAWSIVGTGDFDGDGKADIVWRQNTGDVAIWLMNGATIKSNVGQGQISNTWTLVETGDFDGNGKADILWRQDTGDVAIWFMNGTRVAQSQGVTAISTLWTIQNVNAN